MCSYDYSNVCALYVEWGFFKLFMGGGRLLNSGFWAAWFGWFCVSTLQFRSIAFVDAHSFETIWNTFSYFQRFFGNMTGALTPENIVRGILGISCVCVCVCVCAPLWFASLVFNLIWTKKNCKWTQPDVDKEKSQIDFLDLQIFFPWVAGEEHFFAPFPFRRFCSCIIIAPAQGLQQPY